MKIIILGGQGSGKSTQADLLSKYLNIPRIEMGQLLRNRAEASDETGRKIKMSLDAGILVPNEITIKTLKEQLQKPEFKKGFIIDGYPRNQVQLDALPQNVDIVFYINVSDKEAIKRLTKRGREDDSKELIIKRLEIYHQQTEPLLEKFREQNKLKEISGEKSIEDINKEVIKILEKK